jgi:methyl-accepting chemotaxis protein
MRGIEQINSTISTLETVTQSNASEADNVAHIANQTMDIAKKLVEDARGKKF